MAYRKRQQLADVQGTIAANARLTGELPKDGLYNALLFRPLDGGADETVANIAAEIADVKISIGGRDIIEASPAVLYSLYSFYNGSKNASELNGTLPIMFGRDNMNLTADAEAFSLGMDGVQSFAYEIEMASSVSNVDQIQVFREYRDIKAPLGLHRRLERHTRTFGSTGEQEVTDIPYRPGEGTLAFHIRYDASAMTNPTAIDEVSVIVNGTEVCKVDDVTAQYYAEKAGREWQDDATANSLFSVIFDDFNDLTGFLSHANMSDLRLRITWSGTAPSSYDIYQEVAANLGSTQNPNG